MDFHRIAAFDKESLIKQEEGIPFEWAFGDGTGLANELADDPQPTNSFANTLKQFKSLFRENS
jgi:hypothetical protein